MKWLIFGGNGWIGSQICEYLQLNNQDICISSCRVNDEVLLKEELSF